MRVVDDAGRFGLAEGPLWWPDGTMTWVDVMAGTLHTARPEGGNACVQRVYRTVPPLGSAVRCHDGGFLLASGQALRLLSAEGTITGGITIETGRARLNDGKCDPAGRFWVGSLSRYQDEGGLFRVEPGGGVAQVLTGLTAANGLGWSPDAATMYVTDSGSRTIDAFDFDIDTGSLGKRRRLIETRVGKPDGLAVDDEGCLWVAVWDGAAVHRYDPGGRLMRAFPVPVRRPTSCCFAGSTLWVTAAESTLFTLDTPVTGRPADLYQGGF